MPDLLTHGTHATHGRRVVLARPLLAPSGQSACCAGHRNQQTCVLERGRMPRRAATLQRKAIEKTITTCFKQARLSQTGYGFHPDLVEHRSASSLNVCGHKPCPKRPHVCHRSSISEFRDPGPACELFPKYARCLQEVSVLKINPLFARS